MLFPRSASPFCLTGLAAYESDRAELWNLATGQRIGGISGQPEKAIKRALSVDGKYLALAVLDRSRANDVEVWSLESGQKLAGFMADERNLSMTILDFAGPDEVLTYTFGQQNGKFGYHLRIWDAKTGKSLRQFDLAKQISGDSRYDISPGGQWLATIVLPEVQIYSLQTGESQGAISPAIKAEDGQTVSINSVRFSPDGKELACYCDGQSDSVLTVHDMASGEQTLRLDLSANLKAALLHPASYKGPAMEFVQQPAGFLWAGGGFIDRDTGLMVWNYRPGQLEFSHWQRMLTPAGLIVSSGGHNERKLQVVPFPAEKLEQTLAAFHADAPAIVKPGEKVKLTVKVGEVRFGKPAEAKTSIENALAERLAEDGLEIAADGATLMTVQYKETLGKTLQEVQGVNRFNPLAGGTPTGRSVQSTAGELQIKWTSKDGKTTIYNHVEKLDPGFLAIRDPAQVTEEKIRQQVFAILKIRLAQLPMPYFVPQDKELGTLPLVTASPAATPPSRQALMKQKIEAAKKKRRGR